MKDLYTHLVWATVALLCVGAPATIAAWNLTRQPDAVVVVDPKPVDPQPAPQVVFADKVAQVWKTADGTPEDACQLVEAYSALKRILEHDKASQQLKDTSELSEVAKLGNVIAYGSLKPFGDKYQSLNLLIQAELIGRGLVTDMDGNGKHDIVPIDHDKWVALYSELIEGLSR